MGNKVRVLIVDDDPDLIDQMSILMASEGYEVITAGGQREAEEQLLSVRPDVAIVDLMMEQMDSGFVVTHHLKQLYPQTPVILLTAVTAATGLSFSAASPEARSWVPAETVLDKPVRPEQIKAEVRRLVRRAGPERSADGHH